MIQKIQKYVEQHHMLHEGDNVIAALSGGADSVCLLLVLRELASEYGLVIQAVHVEHGIRGRESLRDARFCRELCADYGIPLHVCGVDAPAYAKKQGLSLEEAARELRYHCLEEAAKSCVPEGNCVIAVAHHMEDSCETMLFHLSRGTGLDGMQGIRPVRDRIIRPLLCVNREEIEAFLAQRGVSFCTDTTNFDTTYTRNRLRHHVLPELKAVNEQAADHFFQFSEEVRETVDYLDEQVRLASNQVMVGKEVQHTDDGGHTQRICEVQLDKKKLGELHPVIGKRLIYQFICGMAGARKDITKQHVEAVRGLCQGMTGRRISLPYGIIAESSYERIFIYRESEQCEIRNIQSLDKREAAAEISVSESCQNISLGDWNFRIRLKDFDGDMGKISEKTYTKWFDYDIIKHNVLLRYRMPGDYLQVELSGGTKKLKDYMIDRKIPRRERDFLPLVADGSHILWVVGHRISEAYKITRETTHILEICAEKRTGENEDERNHT